MGLVRHNKIHINNVIGALVTVVWKCCTNYITEIYNMVKYLRLIALKRISNLLNNINQRVEDATVVQEKYEGDIYIPWEQKAKIHPVTIMMIVTMINKRIARNLQNCVWWSYVDNQGRFWRRWYEIWNK
jgi:hypothetical protein